jgi:homoserine kinase
VSVPATIANLGPGFDCLGMALALRNDWHIRFDGTEPARQGRQPTNPDGEDLLASAARVVYRRRGVEFARFEQDFRGCVPLGRGLGSSATAVVAGMAMAAKVLGDVGDDEIIALATEMEGHPDNAAPALLGGVVISARTDDGVTVQRIESKWVGELRCALAIPRATVSTGASRLVLPRMVTRPDAVFNISRAALLVGCLHTGDWDALRVATQDRLHQDSRLDLLPELRAGLAEAMSLGAHGAFLAGSGPTICGLCSGEETAQSVAEGMADALAREGLDAEARVLSVSDTGADVQWMADEQEA